MMNPSKKILAQLYRITMRNLNALLILCPLVASCQAISWLPDDNAVEEMIEDQIMDSTGVKVDISGSSPE